MNIKKSILKFLMYFTVNSPLFTVKYIRSIRWFLYRKFYNCPKLFVAERVSIETAHKNKNAFFKCNGILNVGRDSYIDYSGGVIVNGRATISEKVCIFTHNHNVHGKYQDWHKNKISFSQLEIQNFAWIGAGAIVLESVNLIAEGSIVAAGAVLTKDTEPYGIYAGNPAKKIGVRNVQKN